MQDSQNKGWVRLYRKIEDNDLWLAEPFTRGQAWVDILLLANHKPRSIFIRGNEVKIERGQFIHSEETLSMRWRWSRGKTRAFLALLETREMLYNRKTRLCAIRTVINYLGYQKTEQQTGQQNVQQKAIRPDNRPDTNKNGKNGRMKKMKEPEPNLATPSAVAEKQPNEISIVMEAFQMKLNPTINYGNRTQRAAIESLLKIMGMEKLLRTIEYAAAVQSEQFAPTITTPYQLKEKLAQLTSYYQKQNSKPLNVISV